MYFDWRLWQLTEGLRARIFGGVVLGLLALAAGIARFAFLGVALARVFGGVGTAAIAWPLVGAVVAVLLRAWLDHARIVQAHSSAAAVQKALRATLFDRVALPGPAWLAGERTGGVMLTMIDGVKQLQTFFGQ